MFLFIISNQTQYYGFYFNCHIFLSLPHKPHIKMSRYPAVRFFVYVVMFGLIIVTAYSCKTAAPLENKTKLTTEEKAVIRMKNKEEKQAEKEYEEAVKKHRKSQAKSTQLMMKEAKKQQRKNNKIHQRSLWDRLFRKKCR